MKDIKKMAFVFGDITLTLTPDDIETIQLKWGLDHPGRDMWRDMTGAEFAEACMEHMKANAKPTRTVLHN